MIRNIIKNSTIKKLVNVTTSNIYSMRLALNTCTNYCNVRGVHSESGLSERSRMTSFWEKSPDNLSEMTSLMEHTPPKFTRMKILLPGE